MWSLPATLLARMVQDLHSDISIIAFALLTHTSQMFDIRPSLNSTHSHNPFDGTMKRAQVAMTPLRERCWLSDVPLRGPDEAVVAYCAERPAEPSALV